MCVCGPQDSTDDNGNNTYHLNDILQIPSVGQQTLISSHKSLAVKEVSAVIPWWHRGNQKQRGKSFRESPALRQELRLVTLCFPACVRACTACVTALKCAPEFTGKNLAHWFCTFRCSLQGCGRDLQGNCSCAPVTNPNFAV